MLINFKPRLYQETIFSTTVNHNTLVVLPTGMGKTAIALMLAVHRLKQFPNSKIMILAPTKPLVEQIMQVFRSKIELSDKEIIMFTGNTKSDKREILFKEAKIIASTPQGMQNDIISNKIDLKDVSLLILDEAHRSVGDYSYNFIVKQYHKKAKYEKILALTASPGSDMEKIQEVMDNLYIEKIEVRNDNDPDVKPYIQEMDIKWINVELGEEFTQIRKFIENCYLDKLKELNKAGFINSTQAKQMSKTELLKLQAFMQGQLAQGNRDIENMKAISKIAEAMKIQHGLELIETQGVNATYMYLNQINDSANTSKVKAVQNLVRDINFRSALIKIRSLYEQKIEHPKLSKLNEIISNEITNNNSKIIIFNQYRDSANTIVDQINLIDGIEAKLFVGQQKKKGNGMSQKKQIEVLNDFREGKFNVLVSTSVGEEGLDIPQVDLVIFYEPIPSAIRTIQRRGRTGRTEKGKMVVLVAKGTRDEAYRWSAHHKEQRMHRNLNQLKGNIEYHFSNVYKEQKTIEQFESKKNIVIYADDREKGSGVIKEIIDLDMDLKLSRMEVADYVLSARVGVEFKTVPDFVDSIIDGRLLDQMKSLKEYFQRPLIVVQGIEDIYSIRNMHVNAINGMLATITISYGIPILYTRNSRETALLLSIIASREQEEIGKDFNPHKEKKATTLKEQQEYIVSSFPGIGGTLSKPLLEKFGSIKKIINSSVDEIKEIEQIGKIKAEKLRKVFDVEYKD